MMWCERDSPIITITGLPSVIFDIAMQRGLCQHRLLAGTRLFFDDFLEETRRISPEQVFTLIQNATSQIPHEELACLAGQRLSSSFPRGLNLTISAASSVADLVHVLQRFQSMFTPLMAPVFFSDNTNVYLRWCDRFGAGRCTEFLQVVYQVSLAHFIKQRSGARSSGRYYFQFTEPAGVEHLWLALGDNLAFNQPCTMVCIAKALWQKAWPGAGVSAFEIALSSLEELNLRQANEQSSLPSFLEVFAVALNDELEHCPQLSTVAESMNLSDATLKRRLKKHGTHFQRELDQCRFLRALQLFCGNKLTCEQVAEALRFHDAGSFKRSIKRGSGMTPRALMGFSSKFI